jgi:CO/xanthine dehydrogenase Mo-binding subunit
MDGPAPAIANALAHAVGVPADRIPLLPELLLPALADGLAPARQAAS